MALYTVAAGDSIWDIADRSLGLQRGTNTPPASVQEIADEMLRIITLNMGKLKVPKGSKGTPGAADLIHAGLVLDLGGAPAPGEAIKKGQTTSNVDEAKIVEPQKQGGGHTKDPGGSEGADTSQKQGGGSPRDPGGSMGAYVPRQSGGSPRDPGGSMGGYTPPRASDAGGGPGRAAQDFGRSRGPNDLRRNTGLPGLEGGTPGGGPARAAQDFGTRRRGNMDVWPRQGSNSAPTGGREPGWGGRPAPEQKRAVPPPRGRGPEVRPGVPWKGPGTTDNSMRYEPWAGQGRTPAERDTAMGYGPRPGSGYDRQQRRIPGGALSWKGSGAR